MRNFRAKFRRQSAGSAQGAAHSESGHIRKITRIWGRGRPVIAYPEAFAFVSGPRTPARRERFAKFGWRLDSEITKRNLGDSGTKLWSRARHAPTRPSTHRGRPQPPSTTRSPPRWRRPPLSRLVADERPSAGGRLSAAIVVGTEQRRIPTGS